MDAHISASELVGSDAFLVRTPQLHVDVGCAAQEGAELHRDMHCDPPLAGPRWTLERKLVFARTTVGQSWQDTTAMSAMMANSAKTAGERDSNSDFVVSRHVLADKRRS